MFFSLILENAAGDKIDMTATANQYMTSQIEGLSPPPGTISTSSYAGMDGSYLNNAFIEKRNVVIHFEMRGVGVEARRHQLYKVVKPSRYVKVYYKTAGIDVFTEGYVETCEVSNFEQLVTGQISILCPDIYWYSTESVMAYYSQITGAFTFPFPTESNPEPFVLGKYNTQNIMEIINDGDSPMSVLPRCTMRIQTNICKSQERYSQETSLPSLQRQVIRRYHSTEAALKRTSSIG